MVSIPAACAALAVSVPLPAPVAGDDARKLLARHRAALAQANDRIAARDACEAKVRADFARAR
jgi:hypothetical protein